MKWILAASFLLFLLLWLAFYPPTYAIVDEAIYFGMAFVLRSGHLFPDPTQVADLYPWIHGRLVSLYPVGNSAAMVPFTFFGWRAAFLYPLLMHLLGAGIFLRLLRRHGLPAWGALLLLFYPANVLYSRTLMSDLPSQTLFLTALWLYQPKPKGMVVSGICFGLLCFLRVANIFLFLPLLLWSLIQALCRKSSPPNSLLLIAGFVPPALGLLALNQISTGSPWIFAYRYAFPEQTFFALKTFPGNVLTYLLALTIMYPLMLLAPFWAKRTLRGELWLTATGYFLAMSFYCYRYRRPNPIAELFGQLRFLLPIIPLFLLSYVDLLDVLVCRWSLRLRALGLILLVLVLVGGNTLVVVRHQEVLRFQEAERRIIYENTSEGSTLAYDRAFVRFIQSAWGQRTFLVVPRDSLSRILRKAPRDAPLFYLQESHQAIPDDTLKPVPIAAASEFRLLRIR